MIDPSEIAGDVIAAGTALAGLILVYVGSLAAGFGGYETTQQPAVRASFQRRAWFGFIGMVVAIAAAGLALIGKWANVDCLVAFSAILLFVALAWGIASALLTVLEIR